MSSRARRQRTDQALINIPRIWLKQNDFLQIVLKREINIKKYWQTH